jgi:hypothetical protein
MNIIAFVTEAKSKNFMLIKSFQQSKKSFFTQALNLGIFGNIAG